MYDRTLISRIRLELELIRALNNSRCENVTLAGSKPPVARALEVQLSPNSANHKILSNQMTPRFEQSIVYIRTGNRALKSCGSVKQISYSCWETNTTVIRSILYWWKEMLHTWLYTTFFLSHFHTLAEVVLPRLIIDYFFLKRTLRFCSFHLI